jgi:hypothetical protein
MLPSISRPQKLSGTSHQELSAADILLNKKAFSYGYLNTTEYTENLEEDQTLYYLVHLVLKNNNVRTKRIDKIEEELDDPVIPNIWVYHKDSDWDKVLEHIKNIYDLLRREDERAK